MKAAAAMLRDFKELLLRADLFVVAMAFLLAWAAISFIKTLVNALISPAIGALFGDSHIVFLRFSIGLAEFPYGSVIQAAIVVGITVVTVFLLSTLYVAHQERRGISAETRPCPECTSAISMVAKRCPYCTAQVPAG
jgi:large conductance mechanosensitive channel